MGEQKGLVRLYMSKGLTRDKCLKICDISKNQLYHVPNGKKQGRPNSEVTIQLIAGVRVEHSNRFVKEHIKKIFDNPHVTYGYHKITSELQLECFYINHKKVYRLMKEGRLLQPKKEREPKNYVQYRIICPEGPLRLMEMDIKQVWIVGQRRYTYILTIIDVFTRVVLYWSCGYEMRQSQVQNAWALVIETYLQPLSMFGQDLNIEVRSDNGPQFCAKKLQIFLKENHLIQAFTHPYTPQENGHVESFHAILGSDLEGNTFENMQILEKHLNNFYEFYNFVRLHGSIRNLPPVTFWKQWDLGNVERIVVDAVKRKVIFKLKIAKQLIEKVPIAGNKHSVEVLALNFLGVDFTPD